MKKFLLPGAVILLLAIGWILLSPANGLKGYGEALPAQAFQATPLNHVGNVYYLDVAIESILASEPGLGRVLLVRSTTGQVPLPVFLPDTLGTNVGFQQRYRLGLRVEERGLLYVERMRKL